MASEPVKSEENNNENLAEIRDELEQRRIEVLVTTEVQKQLDRELALLKDAGRVALKVIGVACAVLLAILTVFGLTAWKDIKKEAIEIVKSRTEDLIQKSDSEIGVKQTLNNLVNRAIVSSALTSLKLGRTKVFELTQNEWNRLRAWLKDENLNIQDFADVLDILEDQSWERKTSDANSFLSEMLNPSNSSTYQWIKKGIRLRRDNRVSVRYAEELNSGESSATLWSTRPTWDFGRKVCGFSSLFVKRAHRACAILPSKRGCPRAVRIVSNRLWSAVIAIPSRGCGKPKTAGAG